MAISQPMCKPLQIELLKQAVNNRNVYAALLLGSIYQVGAKENGKVVIEKDLDKAIAVYRFIQDYDATGVSDWLIGWFYEKALFTEAQGLDENERLNIAKEYYLKSECKKYPKALNSLGKFCYYGWGGYRKDRLEALKFYKDAADGGDVFGCMNCGHTEMKFYYETGDREHLYNARKYFEMAAQYNNAEGWAQLGVTYEECDEFSIAKDCYIKCTMFGVNPYSATGYYRLGCLINNLKISNKDADVQKAVGCSNDANFSVECFKMAYEMYQESIRDGQSIFGLYRTCYLKLIDAFEVIK